MQITGDRLIAGRPVRGSDGRTISVGTLAIRRFLSPVCHQELPDGLWPGALGDANPDSLWRLLGGRLQPPATR